MLKRSLQHRMIRRAPVHCVGAMMSAPSRRFLQHRMNRWPLTGLSGDCHVTCQRPNGNPVAQCDQMNRCPTIGLSDAFAESWVTASNGSMDLVGYIYAIPWAFQGCWSCYKSQTHPGNPPSQPKCILIISLGLAIALRV